MTIILITITLRFEIITSQEDEYRIVINNIYNLYKYRGKTELFDKCISDLEYRHLFERSNLNFTINSEQNLW